MNKTSKTCLNSYAPIKILFYQKSLNAHYFVADGNNVGRSLKDVNALIFYYVHSVNMASQEVNN